MIHICSTDSAAIAILHTHRPHFVYLFAAFVDRSLFEGFALISQYYWYCAVVSGVFFYVFLVFA